MFSQEHRLRKTADIQATFARGRGVFNKYFGFKFIKKSGVSRFTVVVSTKVSKKAVVRNRYKRIIRQLVNDNIAKFPSGDYVITIKPLALKIEEKVLLAELSQVITKI